MTQSRSQHAAWRVDELAPDFTCWDEWTFPIEFEAATRSAREAEFSDFVDLFAELTEGGGSDLGPPARFLFWLRGVLGKLFGWDQPRQWTIPGTREVSLRERLPAHERQASEATLRATDYAEFRPVYRLSNEALFEISNGTVHALLHLRLLPEEAGACRPGMGVYVIPRGTMGRAYLALIAPFRHFIVYPAMFAATRRAWDRHRVAVAA